MKNKTAEEVYVEMLKPAETVTFKVQHRPDDFSLLKDVPGDAFYIRYIHKYTLHVLTDNYCPFMCYNSLKGPHWFPPSSLISVHAAIYRTHHFSAPWTSWNLSHLTNYVPVPLCDCNDANHTTNLGYLISLLTRPITASILVLRVFQAISNTLYTDGKWSTKIVTFYCWESVRVCFRSCRSHLSYRQVGLWCHPQ